MAGLLLHTPAEILRTLFVSLGLGVEPPSTPWGMYSPSEPDSPDKVITVFNVEGVSHGFTMFGERQEHHGFQIRVRSLRPEEGFVKARAIAVAMDSTVYTDIVEISSTRYCVHSITRTSDVLDLGKESPTSKRSIYVINGVASIKKL